MASSFEAFKELDLSRDEVERLGSALKDKEFRKLLVDYVEELQNPENKKLFQKEVTELEKERGNDVTFINPVAGYVIKTSVDGNRKAFVNICANENIKKPTSTPKVQDGSRGLQWSLPHSISPPRDDYDNKGVLCRVFDVVFHPDTMHLAQNNKAFREMVNNTACDAVEANFDVKLDRKNLKFPKLQYKGMPHSTIIKKPSKEKPSEKTPEEQQFFDDMFASIASSQQGKSPSKKPQRKAGVKSEQDDSSKYTKPKFVIKHRSRVELEEFTEDRNSKMNVAIPKELVIEVSLPLLKAASDVVLDVAEKSLKIVSENPAKYKLALTLPYQVNQDSGSAKFDKDLKKLIVTLPVKRTQPISIKSIDAQEHTKNGELCRDDSGVESDHGSPTSSVPSESFEGKALITELATQLTEQFESGALETSAEPKFLDSDIQYSLPEFSCHLYDNILAFTLHVKNVSEGAIEKSFGASENSMHIKFHSISSGFYPVHYALLFQLDDNSKINTDEVSIEAWDNNVVLQIPVVKNCDSPFQSYYVGLSEDDLVKRYLEEPSVVNVVLESSDNVREDMQSLSSNNKATVQTNTVICRSPVKTVSADLVKFIDVPSKRKTKAIDIVGAYSESSGDELSCSYSPSKGKGILKRLSTSRTMSRSISESSVDDMTWTSSFENCYTSMENVIPENGEISSSLKKTVRFKDVVSRQLFRSNSSILGQKKKNQRKARNKKRAQERRHSESELSECDDRKERDLKSNDKTPEASGEKNLENDELNDYFDLDV